MEEKTTDKKQIIKYICYLIPAVVVIFLLLFMHHAGSFPTVPDVVRSLPGIGRVLPVHGRVSQTFSQDELYEKHFNDFLLDGDRIISTSDDPWILVYTDTERAGRILTINISQLNVGRTGAQIFFSHLGEPFSEGNSVRFTLENGHNAVMLPYSGYGRLRLDLTDVTGVSMVVNEVISANYVFLPASLRVMFFSISIMLAVLFYLWIFKKELFMKVCKECKEKLAEIAIFDGDCSSEKKRYLIAALFVGLLMAITYWQVPVRFGNHDEDINLHMVAGYFAGTPMPTLLYSNILFGYFLSGLYRIAPIVPWYGVVHIVFIFFSQLMILKSFMKIAAKKNISPLVPLGLYMALYAFAMFYITTVLYFTTTPALMGAAACVVAASLLCGESKRARVADVIAILTLIFFSFIIRWRSGDGVLRFFIVVMLFKVGLALISKEEIKQKLRQVCLFATIGVCVLGVITFAREFNSHMANVNGMREWASFNSQRANFGNFPNLAVTYDRDQELFASIGWDRDLFILAQDWFHMDERITEENLRVLNSARAQNNESLTFLQNLENSIEAARTFIDNNDIARSATIAVLFGFLAHSAMLIMQIIKDKLNRRKNLLHMLFSLAIAGGFLASLVWLGERRVNIHAFFVPLLPAACLMFFSVLNTWNCSVQRALKKYLPVTIIALFIIIGYFINVPFDAIESRATSLSSQRHTQQRMAAERYAIENSDDIFVMHSHLTRTPVSVFTNYNGAGPINLFNWQGATRHEHPGGTEKLRANGLDEFYAEDLLRPGFYFLTLTIEHGTAAVFMRYMYNRYSVVPEVVDSFYGVYVVRFVE